MAVATLTSKGQVTLPKEIRERLGLETGDKLDFRIDEKGRVLVQIADLSRPLAIAGRLKKYAKARALTVEEMNESIARSAVERYRRAVRR